MKANIKIIEDTERLISSNNIKHSDADILLNVLDGLLFSDYIDSRKFGVLLKNKIITPLYNKIKEIENELIILGRSRSKLPERKKLEINNTILNNLLINIFTSYSDFLDGCKEYKLFEQNRLERIEVIYQNLLTENINNKDPFPESYDKKNANKIISEIEEYYKKAFLNPQNILFVKTKLTQLEQSLKSKISDIQNKIGDCKECEDKYQKELLSFSAEKSDEKDRVFDLYNCIGAEITNLNLYKNDLIKLYNHIIKEYPFIDSKPIAISDITIFGDSNIEIIKHIYLEFSDFIDKTVTSESDFVQTFLDLPITHKINFINGSLPDYAYFIKGLKPFFVKRIKEDAGSYNRWWSERFLFSGKEKSSKDISNILSGLEHGRKASKKSATNNIVNFLSSSYNRPT